MARILIISSTHLSRNPRTFKEATTLGRAGHDVEVLTISNRRRSEELDRELLRGAPFQRTTLDFLQPAVAARAGGLWRRLRTRLARAAVRRLRRESPWSLGPAGPLFRLARDRPADLTIVHNELPAWIGMRLLEAGRKVAADFEDWYSEDLPPSDRAWRPLRLLRQIEAALLRQAAYASTTSDALAAALAERYRGKPPLVLTNSGPLQPAPSRDDGPRAVPRLVWFSQTIGPGRGLEEFLSLWSRTLRASRVTLIGEVRPDYRSRLEAGLPPDFRARLSFQAFAPPGRLPELLAGHDIGLALEPAGPPNKDLTISNKILQYLNAGLAVLATATAGHREVLKAAPDSGELLDLQAPVPAAALVDRLLADAARLRAMQVAARTAAEQRFCWEREEPKLLAAVETALAADPGAPFSTCHDS